MRTIKKGATSQSLYFDILDSASTTGGRKTGLAYNTSSLIAYYVRNGGSATVITLATLAAANSAWSSGGFKEVDATNMPGIYRLDVPDAAFASGADSVVISILGASGMVQASYDVQLVDNLAIDVYARLGAPAGASVSADVAAVKADTANIGTAGAGLTALGDTRIAHLDADVSSRLASGSYTAPDNAGIASIEAKTNNLPSDPADQSLIIAATDSLSSQISGLNNLNQSDIRNAVGLASADLDTQLATLATSAALTAVQDHGDTYWLTATGFSTSADITGAVSTLEGYGDTNWATATGFSTYDGSDTAGTTTLLSRLTDTRAGYLDNLSAGAVATAASIAALPQAIWGALTSALTTVGSIGKLLVTNIDAAISSRLAAADYTAPDDTAVLAAISGLNDLSAAQVNAEVDTAIGDAALATAASLATTDGKIDAVQAKTDQLGFSGSLVNANIAAVNGTQVQGTGASGDEWGPA